MLDEPEQRHAIAAIWPIDRCREPGRAGFTAHVAQIITIQYRQFPRNRSIANARFTRDFRSCACLRRFGRLAAM